VAEIVERGGRVAGVRTEAGEFVAAEVVVSNADPSWVYGRMASARVAALARRKVSRMRSSMGLFVGYFGVRGTYESLAHHTVVMGPRYGGLLRDVFRRRVLADDFSLYLHAPARTDPSMAPAGHESFYVLSPVPNLRGDIDWSREAEPYFDRILESLEARLLPGLRERIVTRHAMTPADFENDLRSVDGAGFGPEPRLLQSAWFRYHNRCPWLDGLYFAGAGTHPGGGIPGVLCSAKVLDRIVPEPSVRLRTTGVAVR
jgi:phytoene desaturase